MTNTTEDNRCKGRVTIASGVLRGERFQCLKTAPVWSEYCGNHRPSWERKPEATKP